MNAQRKCSACGLVLSADATEDVCPKCLLEVGLETSSSHEGSGSEHPTLPPAESSTTDEKAVLPHQKSNSLSPSPSTKVRYFGDYELLEEIARGGMGIVYKARQVSLNRIVALKMILAGQLASEADVQRFHTEAEAAAKLDHPGIVPIHEVGEHEGQHYFSMGFVDGPSLADRLSQGPLPPEEAVELAKQVADAIAYAHERGVIHRDLKPANVLLQKDRGGKMENEDGAASPFLPQPSAVRPRITDFGLAKEMEADSHLTGSGQILGTPSYMPPEQAAGKTNEVGPTSDVYALGAVLYVMLTGRPPFQAANPMDTLLQVLDKEPVPPRQLDAGISPDLDTICLKCLEKEPRNRYTSARELADDLERHLHDEPIHARPIGQLEQASRWLRKQRRSVVFATNAVVATLLFALCAVLAWYMYSRTQRSYLNLLTDAQPLVCEILDKQNRPVTSPQYVPVLQPIELAAGDYQIALARPGRFSQNSWVQLRRGRVSEFDVSLDDQVLWDASDVPESYQLVEFADGIDVVGLDRQEISRRDGTTGELLWTCDVANSSHNALQELPAWSWTASIEDARKELLPRVVGRALDLNQDGESDIVCAGRHQAWVVAVSGTDGQVLWAAAVGSDVREPKPAPSSPGLFHSTIHGPPQVADDINADGVPDLLITYADNAANEQAPWFVETLSGASGETLWRYHLSADFPNLRAVITPDNLDSFADDDRYDTGEVRRTIGRLNYFGREQDMHIGPAVLSTFRGQNYAILALGSSDELVALDVRSGSRVDLPKTSTLPAALAPWRYDAGSTQPSSEWPLVVDLDSDGHDEAIYPADTWDEYPNERRTKVWGAKNRQTLLAINVSSNGSPPWAVLVAADGDGSVRWWRPLLTADGRIDRCLVGPDINGDGHREVFVATLSGAGPDLYIDALSGSDGQSLWIQRETLAKAEAGARQERHGAEYLLGSLRWGPPGNDGWPQLIVTLRPDGREDWLAYLVSAGSGRLTQTATGLRGLQPADVDGDGLDELFAYRSGSETRGSLLVFRGLGLNHWRRLDDPGQPAADFDQDGIRDVIHLGRGELHARSGRTGGVLWRQHFPTLALEFAEHDICTAVRCVQDVDGDSVPDVLHYFWEEPRENVGYGYEQPWPPEIVSGRTGVRLWNNRGVEGYYDRGPPICKQPALELRDLKGDGQIEVVRVAVPGWNDRVGRHQAKLARISLAVFGERDREFRWEQSLSAQYGESARGEFPYTLEDGEYPIGFGHLDSDGTLDLVVPAEVPGEPESLQWRALSGSDGELLWSTTLASAFSRADSLRQVPPPALADLDGDDRPEVILLEFDKAEKESQRTARLRVLTPNGNEKWRCERVVAWKSDWNLRDETQRHHRPQPVVVRVKDGPPLICVNLWGDPGHLVFVDCEGQLVHDIPVPSQRAYVRAWMADVDGDAGDELFWLSNRELCAASATAPSVVLWKRAIPGAQSAEIIEWVEMPDRSPQVVIVDDRQRVFGIEATTGNLVWNCPAPQAHHEWRSDARRERRIAVLGSTAPGHPPLVLFDYQNHDETAELENTIVGLKC